jgi:hypothetical protein
MTTEPVEPPSTAARAEAVRQRALVVGSIATLIIPINFFVFWAGELSYLKLFTVLALAQLVLGIAAVIMALHYRSVAKGGGLGMAIGFGLVALGGPVGFALAVTRPTS